MPKSLRFEFDHAVFQDVLNDPTIRARLASMGAAVAEAAGDGFETEMKVANFGFGPRPMAFVWAATPDARLAEATSKALTRAIDAARGA